MEVRKKIADLEVGDKYRWADGESKVRTIVDDNWDGNTSLWAVQIEGQSHPLHSSKSNQDPLFHIIDDVEEKFPTSSILYDILEGSSLPNLINQLNEKISDGWDLAETHVTDKRIVLVLSKVRSPSIDYRD